MFYLFLTYVSNTKDTVYICDDSFFKMSPALCSVRWHGYRIILFKHDKTVKMLTIVLLCVNINCFQQIKSKRSFGQDTVHRDGNTVLILCSTFRVVKTFQTPLSQPG